MHSALRKVLGTHVQQKGSLVDAQRTRFDFSHNEPMTQVQIREVEKLVNDEIRRTPDAMPDSPITLSRPMSPVARACVPPHSSVENSPNEITRTRSPYFSPNSATAPASIASG